MKRHTRTHALACFSILLLLLYCCWSGEAPSPGNEDLVVATKRIESESGFDENYGYAGAFWSSAGEVWFFIGAPQYPNGTSSVGRLELRKLGPGEGNDFNNTTVRRTIVDPTSELVKLTSHDNFGKSILTPGDLNADYYPDLIVGAPGEDQLSSGRGQGMIWILYLNEDFTVKEAFRIPEESDNRLGLDPEANFGISLAMLGDIDRDGNLDIAVGARGSGVTYGAVYILNLDGQGGFHNFSKIDGPVVGDNFGRSVVVIGDVNRDGVLDLAVGADDTAAAGLVAVGAFYILFMNPDSTTVNQRVSHVYAEFNHTIGYQAQFGIGLGAIGDADYDGVPDLMVSSSTDVSTEHTGEIFVIYLHANGTTKRYVQLPVQGEWTFGRFILPLPDLNSDGHPDLYAADCEKGDGEFVLVYLGELGLCPRVTMRLPDGVTGWCNETSGEWLYTVSSHEGGSPFTIGPQNSFSFPGDLQSGENSTIVFTVNPEGEAGKLVIQGCFEAGGVLHLEVDPGSGGGGFNYTLELIEFLCRTTASEFSEVRVTTVGGEDACEEWSGTALYGERSISVLVGGSTKSECEEDERAGDGGGDSGTEGWVWAVVVIAIVVVVVLVALGIGVTLFLSLKRRQRKTAATISGLA